MSSSRRNNKGQISIQFNWIFVIIIGAVFLGFFFTMINTGAKTSEQKVSGQLAKSFENQLSVASNEPGLVKIIDDTSNLDIELACEQDEGVYELVVNKVRIRDTKYDLYFSPETLSGSKVIFWMQDWLAPYRIGTFTYITNQHHAYVFLDTGSSQSQELIEEFGRNITSYVVDTTLPLNEQLFPTEELNQDHYTYVVFADEQSKLPKSKIMPVDSSNSWDNVNILVIDPNTTQDIFSHGDIYFLSKDQYPYQDDGTELIDPELNDGFRTGNSFTGRGQNPQSSYLGKASLYGAIFSETKDRYECAMNKAIFRLHLQSLLQLYKLEETFPYVTQNCKELLGGSLSDGPYKKINESLPLIENGFDREHIDTLSNIIARLDDYNQDLQFVANCPSIY